MIDYEKDLNPDQLRVVMEDTGPLLVIAGAGSGKTRTLTYRVARLIESGISPQRILLATFTNKAARAMLSRVQTLIDSDVSYLWGGTFHHVAHRILRLNAHLLGYDRSFSIIDAEDARQLMNTCTSELGVDQKGSRFPKGDVLGDILSFSINTEVPMEQVIDRRYPFFYQRLGDIQAVISQYISRKKSLNVMDFDDLLFNWRQLLLEHPEVLKIYSERFVHILVDEYQDTNMIQADIMDLMASCHRNLAVVGDDSQSIYSFRGANFANIMRFPERYPDSKIFKLETNYRSTPEILHMANLSIINNEKQFQKELRAVRKAGIRPILVPARNAIQQANFVAQRMIELVRSGVPVHEIAVLYRAHYHSMELQMEMVRRGIPFDIRSGIRFFEQAHIKDVTAYMRVVLNPFDELAWKRLLGLYSRIGKATAQKIWIYLSRKPDPLRAVLAEEFLKCASKAALPGLSRLQATMKTLMDSSQEKHPANIIEIVLEGGYREYLEETYTDMASREEDILQLGAFSGKFDTLEAFLSELALLTNMTADDEHLEEDTQDKVILSSIHQAKGLEWSVVFMIWCAEGMLPLARALKEPDGEEEERRLFYVAITRAKDQLYLCYPVVDYGRGMGSLPLGPSRFIKEITPLSFKSKERPYDQWIVDED
jgi:DNA helicase-2/ATP-dependent DNA helicase PcrA